jgi:hypothetical protein
LKFQAPKAKYQPYFIEITSCLHMIYAIAGLNILGMLPILIEKTERGDTTNLQSSIFNSGLSGLGLCLVVVNCYNLSGLSLTLTFSWPLSGFYCLLHKIYITYEQKNSRIKEEMRICEKLLWRWPKAGWAKPPPL